MHDMVSAVATMMSEHPATFVTVREPNLWAVELANGYTVANWLSDTNPDRKRFLLTIASKYGFPAEVDEALRDRFHVSEFVLSQRAEAASEDRVEAKGLGTAFLLAGVGVSLRSEDQWSRIRIPLRHTWFDEACQERTDDVEALNLSVFSQVASLSGLLLEQSRRDLRGNPLTLADRKHECFPHLAFGRDVDGQLKSLPHAILPVVIGKLVTLDDASRAWRLDSTMTSPQLPQCHPESESTMQQFGDQRMFQDPKGDLASILAGRVFPQPATDHPHDCGHGLRPECCWRPCPDMQRRQPSPIASCNRPSWACRLTLRPRPGAAFTHCDRKGQPSQTAPSKTKARRGTCFPYPSRSRP